MFPFLLELQPYMHCSLSLFHFASHTPASSAFPSCACVIVRVARIIPPVSSSNCGFIEDFFVIQAMRRSSLPFYVSPWAELRLHGIILLSGIENYSS
ncbi:hypothetical protein BDV23DRAFT_100167 [Aspergillus alliaceus]|uniref:Uncharacterized protein n=1 Tax=Petromyces alliaceus TaxID=209559 RepID=A0A5N6FE97_PETAA|nr:uncharacterized protein BDW43DRAFT_244715 [Aspergillus alliaceus]KAB8227525.1 hypothetical protein BDW43DRAFT_244715 [Aspergillus alliaceus]KAE8389245.1 hypothetical protein BDV23DRAFT_100167 [Aspergillus alliaceus]